MKPRRHTRSRDLRETSLHRLSAGRFSAAHFPADRLPADLRAMNHLRSEGHAPMRGAASGGGAARLSGDGGVESA